METRKYKENEYINIVNDLNKGLVVGFPTETVYGLAIVYDSIDAFKSLYEIKHREITKPISMMVYDKNTIQKVFLVLYIVSMQNMDWKLYLCPIKN